MLHSLSVYQCINVSIQCCIFNTNVIVDTRLLFGTNIMMFELMEMSIWRSKLDYIDYMPLYVHIYVYTNIWGVFKKHRNVYYEKLCIDFKFILHQNKTLSLASIFHELVEVALYLYWYMI